MFENLFLKWFINNYYYIHLENNLNINFICALMLKTLFHELRFLIVFII